MSTAKQGACCDAFPLHRQMASSTTGIPFLWLTTELSWFDAHLLLSLILLLHALLDGADGSREHGELGHGGIFSGAGLFPSFFVLGAHLLNRRDHFSVQLFLLTTAPVVYEMEALDRQGRGEGGGYAGEHGARVGQIRSLVMICLLGQTYPWSTCGAYSSWLPGECLITCMI